MTTPQTTTTSGRRFASPRRRVQASSILRSWIHRRPGTATSSRTKRPMGSTARMRRLRQTQQTCRSRCPQTNSYNQPQNHLYMSTPDTKTDDSKLVTTDTVYTTPDGGTTDEAFPKPNVEYDFC